MTIAESLFAVLSGNSTITALTAERIYPGVIPQAEIGRPAMTYYFESGEYFEYLGGRSETERCVFELSCWSPVYLESRTLARTAREQLIGFRGTFGTHYCESLLLINDFDGGLEPDTGLYRAFLRFEMAYR